MEYNPRIVRNLHVARDFEVFLMSNFSSLAKITRKVFENGPCCCSSEESSWARAACRLSSAAESQREEEATTGKSRKKTPGKKHRCQLSRSSLINSHLFNIFSVPKMHFFIIANHFVHFFSIKPVWSTSVKVPCWSLWMTIHIFIFIMFVLKHNGTAFFPQASQVPLSHADSLCRR